MTFDLLQINPAKASDKFSFVNKHTAGKDVGATGYGAKLEIQA